MQRIGLLIGLVLITFLVSGCGSTTVGMRLKTSSPEASSVFAPGIKPVSPVVDPDAFKNQGDLAFVHDVLYNLDGLTGQVSRLTQSGPASFPAWSHDGEWLAFVRVTDFQAMTGPLWLVHRDGTQAHRVLGLSGGVTREQFSWSPTADVLAVGRENGLWLVPTEGGLHRLVATRTTPTFVWAPDGKSLAFNDTLAWTKAENQDDALYTVRVDGGKPVQRLVAPGYSGIRIAAWWPNGKGLLYWVDPLHSCSLAADGMGLWSLGPGEATPRLLGTGLAYATWLSFSPEGRLLLVKGDGRIAWANKQLVVLNVTTGSMEKLPDPDGNVALDPAFSPDGKRIAFVAAKDEGPNWGSDAPGGMAAWAATRTIWIENADGTGAHPLPSAGTGVYQPAWSKDGSSLLYVRDNALWTIRVDGGKPQRVLDLSSEQKDLFYYYGFVLYDDYAWFQP